MTHKHYFRQSFLITALILLSLCLIFVFLFHMEATQAFEDNVYQTESTRTEGILFRATAQWAEITSISSSIATIQVPAQELSSSQNYWANKIWSELLDSHTGGGAYIKNIEVAIGSFVTSPTALAHQRQLGKLEYFGIYTTDDISWPYLFDLQTNFKNTSLNDVTITISGYHLSRQVFASSDRLHMDYLLTPDNIVLLSSDKNAFFQDISTVYPDILSGDKLGKSLADYGSYYVTLSSVDEHGFRVLTLVPKAFYAAQRTSVPAQTLLTICCLLPIALLMAYYLSRYFYRPVKDMVSLLKTYVQDDVREYENEIAFIRQNIHKYPSAQEQKKVLDDTVQKLQVAQSAVLQHQINHHFLFNTLENIKAISVTELGIGNEIEDSIIQLNNIIHEGIYQKNAFVPLSQELHLAKSYMTLMQLRFPDVDAHWEVDDALLECMVYKFSIQPILENCFAHAFTAPGQKDKCIHIQITQRDGILCTSISDNGRGMDKAKIRYLNQMLTSAHEPEATSHVGIYNVHQRITGVFGSRYGIRIEGASPGTLVEIRYPVTYASNTATEQSLSSEVIIE